MDNEEIFAMEAGEELDHKVTKDVMNDVSENYSEDISSAWKVVKKLEEMGWRIDILSSKEKETVGGVKMVDDKPVSLHYLAGNVKSENLPEAICKAALLIAHNSQRISEIESNKEF